MTRTALMTWACRSEKRPARCLSKIFASLLFCGFSMLPATAADFADLLRVPDSASATSGQQTVALVRDGTTFKAGTLAVETAKEHGRLALYISSPDQELQQVKLRWNVSMPDRGWKYLGDAWERAYGDLEWKPLDAQRRMPWYFAGSDGQSTHAYGVMVRPAAFCSWQADKDGITLTLDVRNGGGGVRLGQRKLDTCTIVTREGHAGESAFAALCAFCHDLCPDPRLPKEPVYGFNDWYCDYGKNSAQSVRDYADFLMRLAPKEGPRPFMVIDDGWQPGGGSGGGEAWDTNNANFAPSMSSIAADIKAKGARPGLWCRLLLPERRHPAAWRVADGRALDPSVPEVRAHVRETVARIRSWGFELIKHDYSTYDMTRGWNALIPETATWHYADRSLTTAEIIRQFYQDVRAGAGDDTIVIGCNTIGHLAAGLVEVSRIGDDTSGREWARTCKMGVNSLAFRGPQHGTFFAADADCVGLTKTEQIPWRYNRQWMDLVARSGTPLFISFKKGSLAPAQEQEVADALAIAARPPALGEPLDWMETTRPAQWKLMGGEKTYDWGPQHP